MVAVVVVVSTNPTNKQLQNYRKRKNNNIFHTHKEKKKVTECPFIISCFKFTITHIHTYYVGHTLLLH